MNVVGPGPWLVCFTNLSSWTRLPDHDAGVAWESPTLQTVDSWNEAVVSWNVQPADGIGLTIEAQPGPAGSSAPWYVMGHWSAGGATPIERTSVRGQRDDIAQVKTDILAMRAPDRQLRIRVRAQASDRERALSAVRLIAVSLADTQATPEERPPLKAVWGRELDVPEKSQVSYPGGEGWCSPTTVSMALHWWARELNREELIRDVPEVAAGVHDPGWSGTGNWPFNTAYAGSFPGMIACAARLRDIRALEELIAAGIPVPISAHPPALRGKPMETGSGHLIVCVGFTEEGDVIANDPWAREEQGQRVRRVYKRDNVRSAWAHAARLAYLIAPADRAGVFPAQWQ
jgi:hypothetical protein